MLESNPSDARYVIDRQQICFETWIESEKSNTINTFDVGGVRATTVIVNENENTDREEIL